MKDSLGDRMKAYENCFKHFIPKNHPVIIRVDGKSFHTLTRGLEKPFDEKFIECMEGTARYLLKNVQCCKMAYIQSDEISLLLDDRATEGTEPFFNNNLNKMISISSSMATYRFNKFANPMIDREGMFDSRAFILSDEEVPNYFIWRMRDWERNSLQMVARSKYSAKELHQKNRIHMHDMLMKKGINWAKIKPRLKNGTIFYKEGREIKRVSRKFDYLDLKKFIGEL